jgi:type IV secretion system protein VirB4
MVSLRRSEDLEAYRDITDDVVESDFVPYACHYNAHTLLTKNGELLQTVRLTGQTHEMAEQAGIGLRAALRAALRECVPSNSFALWLHTIRRECDRSAPAPGGGATPFARKTHDAWEERNRFRHQYANEVYVTLVREGQSAPVANARDFLIGLVPSRDKRWRNAYLDTIYEDLNATAEALLDRLQLFGAHRLTLAERAGAFYSEPCQFLEKIINLADRPMPIVEQDLSTYLTSGEITFGFNAMEVRVGERRRFASMLTIKEYKEASLDMADAFLRQPIEFIATQYVNFIRPERALEDYLDQKMLTRLSEDAKLAEISEIDDLIRSEGTHKNTDFGEQQMTIFILADSMRLLERDVRRAIAHLAEGGMVVIREDLRFEQCYWAQLPGNFEFISRTTPTSTARIGGFSNLHDAPTGTATGNRWGPAVTSFHTTGGIPYFFNFHHGAVGHTSVLGDLGPGKAVLVNFLLTHATKFSPRILYFDTSGSSEVFLPLLGGTALRIAPDRAHEGKNSPAMNPFSLPDAQEHREFLARWVLVLLRVLGHKVADREKETTRDALSRVLALPRAERNFNAFVQALRAHAPEVAALYAPWAEDGEYGHVFTHGRDALDTHPQLVAFDLSRIMEEPAILIPAFSYLLQRCVAEIDGRTPSILVLDEAWTLLKNSHVVGNLGGWLDMLMERNAIGIFTAGDVEEASQEALTKPLLKRMATQLYLPSDAPPEWYHEAFGLSESECSWLEAMDTEEYYFFLKRHGEAVVCALDLTGMDEVLAGLSGTRLSSPEESEEELGKTSLFG